MTRLETQTKWVSNYNVGDKIRHVMDIGEKGVVVAVLFSMGSIEYKVSTGTEVRWWYEQECVRFYKQALTSAGKLIKKEKEMKTDYERQDQILAAIDAQDNHMLYELTELVDMGMELTAENLQVKFYIGYERAINLIEKYKLNQRGEV